MEMQPLNCSNNSTLPCDALSNDKFVFREAKWVSVLCLACISIFFKALGFIILYYKSKINV